MSEQLRFVEPTISDGRGVSHKRYVVSPWTAAAVLSSYKKAGLHNDSVSRRKPETHQRKVWLR